VRGESSATESLGGQNPPPWRQMGLEADSPALRDFSIFDKNDTFLGIF